MGGKIAKRRRAEQRRQEHEAAKLKREHDRAMASGLGLTKARPTARVHQPEPYRRPTPDYPSHDSGAGVCPRRESPQYTGDELIGVATMHKSNMVPVSSQDQAEDISKMRRN